MKAPLHTAAPWLLLLSTLCCDVQGLLSSLASPRVQLADGSRLRGKYVLSRAGKKIRAFLSIPYAKPPVGDRRFKVAEPADGWAEERWAVDPPKPCLQPDSRHGLPIGQEDCLYLNIYAPTTVEHLTVHTGHSEKKHIIEVKSDVETNAIIQVNNSSSSSGPEACQFLPVLVFFHGGGLERGHIEPFTHEYLLEEGGMVLVTVQYRLGLLGFLSSGDEMLPANLGFKDQRFALQWIQRNIELFGGCPKKVTISGHEVGGAAVHFHMLFAPPRNEFFRAGISMSGTALSPWALRSPSEVALLADRVAALSGCPRESQQMAKCLREKPAEEFVELLHKYRSESRSFGEWTQGVPVLGGVLESSGAEGAFITGNPWEKKITIPWMVGVTDKEMLYEFTGYLADRSDQLFMNLEECFNDALPKVLGYEFSDASDFEVATSVRNFYLKNRPAGRGTLADLVDAVSDPTVVYPVFESVRRAPRHTTWLYLFNFLGVNTYGPSVLDGRIGPARGDDLFFLFPRPLGKNMPRKNKDPEKKLSKKFVKYWINFITNLNPSPTEMEGDWEGARWGPIAPSTAFLNISQGALAVGRPFLSNRMNFWARQPYPVRDDHYDVSTMTM